MDHKQGVSPVDFETRNHVGFIAGFSGLLSTGAGGTRAIADRISGSRHYRHYQWRDVLNELLRLHDNDCLPRPICLFGHSMGAEAVLEIADKLNLRSISIDYVGVIDLTLGPTTSAGSNIELLQEFHSAFNIVKFKDFAGQHEFYDLDKVLGRNIGHSAAARSEFTQNTIVEKVNFLLKGGNQVTRDKFYIGEGRRINDADFIEIAEEYNVPEYLLRAVTEIEAAGKGSHSSGALVARYEPHVAWDVGKEHRQALAAGGLAYESWKPGYPRGQPYPYIDQCEQIAGREIAALSTSWGMGQVMGFNHALCGFDSAVDMVTNFAASEANQISGMMAFIEAKHILDALRREDWHTFAETYNGTHQERHDYEGRLARAAKRWKTKLGDREQTAKTAPGLPEPGDALDQARKSLAQHFPNLNEQNRELVLALAMLLGKPPDRTPGLLQNQNIHDPSLEAGFSLPDAHGGGMYTKTLNLRSKTTLTGIFSVLAGLAMFVLPDGNMILELARSIYPNADPGTLVTGGLAIIFAREAIAKNGNGK